MNWGNEISAHTGWDKISGFFDTTNKPGFTVDPISQQQWDMQQQMAGALLQQGMQPSPYQPSTQAALLAGLSGGATPLTQGFSRPELAQFGAEMYMNPALLNLQNTIIPGIREQGGLHTSAMVNATARATQNALTDAQARIAANTMQGIQFGAGLEEANKARNLQAQQYALSMMPQLDPQLLAQQRLYGMVSNFQPTVQSYQQTSGFQNMMNNLGPLGSLLGGGGQLMSGMGSMGQADALSKIAMAGV